jgi:hypothetical protein
VRLDLAAAVGAIPASVREAKALGVAAGCGDHGQMLGVDRWAADRGADRRRPEGPDTTAKVCRQDLLELDQCPYRSLLDAGHGGTRGGAKADRDRDRLLVVEQKRWFSGPCAKPVAAGRTGQGVHWVAELAQPLDVPADRPAGHREPVCQLCARPVAARLEQREKRKKAARGLRHVDFIFFEI